MPSRRQAEGLFTYMKDWSGGECGYVGSARECAQGKLLVSGTRDSYFAFCVQYEELYDLYGYDYDSNLYG